MEKEELKEEIIEEKKNKKENKKEKIKELENEINILKDKNMRVSAEMINTLRRKDEETSKLLKYANESLILEIINVLDNFERALSSNSNNEEVINYQKGINMIYENLKSILTKYEVKEIESINKEFDPSYHQAVMTEKKDGVKPNIVIDVMMKGYTYKDKVIRPAMVKVSE